MKVSSARGWKLVLVSLIVGIICNLCSAPAYADCSTDNPADCIYVPKGQSLNVKPAFSGASPSCQEIANSCAGDIMAPTLNQSEWSSFLASGIFTGVGGITQCATVTTCTCSPSTVANGTVSAYPGCQISCNTGFHVSGSSCATDSYSYAWVQSGFGSCSLSCGGGTQTQSVSCQQTDKTTSAVATVDNSLCVAALGAEPATSQSCNAQACAVCNAENLNVWVRTYKGYFGFSTQPETCGGADGCPGYTPDANVSFATSDWNFEDAAGPLFNFTETNYNALNGYDGECLGCGQNGGGGGQGTVDTLAYIEANSNLTNSMIIGDYLTTSAGKADANMQQCYNSGNISNINIVEYTIVSPLKVNIAGGNARLNVSRPLTFTMTRPNGKIVQRTTTGGLNADEAWLMVNKDGKGIKNGDVVNGDNWFSDGRNHDSAYDHLAEEFSSYVKKDEHGHSYIPLQKLTDVQKAAAQQALMQPGDASVKANLEPSKDLLLLDVNDNVYFASDFFDRIYVSYFNVGETDTSFSNHILQRSLVRDLNGQYHFSADQWFAFQGNKTSATAPEASSHFREHNNVRK